MHIIVVMHLCGGGRGVLMLALPMQLQQHALEGHHGQVVDAVDVGQGIWGGCSALFR